MKEILRRTWAEIDLDALAHNVSVIRWGAGEARLCAVVKADAYGHGAVRLSRELESLGADCFAVSNLEEGLQLRRAGIASPVLILGYTPPEEAAVLAREGISQCVYSTEYGRSLSLFAQASGATVKIHVKIDTGMGRLGFRYQDPQRDGAAVEDILKLCALHGLQPEGIFTHFASADEGEAGAAFTQDGQLAAFSGLVEKLEQRGLRFPIRHCANSAAIFDYPQARMDMVRAGIVLYGLPPSDCLRNEPDLRPLLSLRSVVSFEKTVPAGTTISYGRTWTAPESRRIATIPVGYADGYPRVLSGKADVLIRGRRCPIVGRVCMDQMMADVTDLDELHVGDTVTLIGKDGSQEITAAELADLEGSIPYEIICGISKRVPRVYLKDGKVESIYNVVMNR